MAESGTGACSVCGKAGGIHLTEIRDGIKTSRSYCPEHLPEEFRRKVNFPTTPAEEVAWLRASAAQREQALGQRVSDPAELAKYKAEFEKLIEDIQAGRRRLFDNRQAED